MNLQIQVSKYFFNQIKHENIEIIKEILIDTSGSTPFHHNFENTSKRRVVKIKILLRLLSEKKDLNVNFLLQNFTCILYTVYQ